MKNHELVNGRLLQTNKKWSALKQSQKQWIGDVVRVEYERYVAEKGGKPLKKQKEVVLDSVYERINERGIWIPYAEARTSIYKIIDRLNKKP